MRSKSCDRPLDRGSVVGELEKAIMSVSSVTSMLRTTVLNWDSGVLLGLLSMATTACGPSRESAVASVASHDEQLRARAAFDMQCPTGSLQITPIEQRPTVFHDDVLYTVIAGVRGCGQQATYVYDEYRGLWVLNADSQPAKK